MLHCVSHRVLNWIHLVFRGIRRGSMREFGCNRLPCWFLVPHQLHDLGRLLQSQHLYIPKPIPCLCREHIRDVLKEIFDASVSQFKTIWIEFFLFTTKICYWIYIEWTMQKMSFDRLYNAKCFWITFLHSLTLHFSLHSLSFSSSFTAFFIISFLRPWIVSFGAPEHWKHDECFFLLDLVPVKKKCKGHARR